MHNAVCVCLQPDFPATGGEGIKDRGVGLLKAGRNLWLNLKPLVVYQSKGNGIASFRVGAESEKGAFLCPVSHNSSIFPQIHEFGNNAISF